MEKLDLFSNYLTDQLGYRVEAQRVLIEMLNHNGVVFYEIAIYYMKDGSVVKYVVSDAIALKIELAAQEATYGTL